MYDDKKQLERNIKISEILLDCAILVANIILTKTGEKYVEYKKIYLLVSKKLQGNNIFDIKDKTIAWKMGCAIAELHMAFIKCEKEIEFWDNSLLKEMKGTPKMDLKEKSYMLAFPKKEEDIYDIAGIMNRLQNTPGMELISHNYEEGLELMLKIDEKQYEAEVYPTEITLSPMFRIQHLFPDVDKEKIENAKTGLSVVIEFGEDALVSYHAQLKIIHAVLPDAIAVMDTSSEKILSGKWVQLAAVSKIPPAPRYIYTVQAVAGEEDCVWLHSHGLNRCGLPEMEILNSKKDTYQNHYNIIETMANRLLEKKDSIQMGEPFFLARVTEQIPLVTTLINWKEAVSFYPDDMLGGKNDREDGHNENTCGIFVYLSQEDVEKRQCAPVFVFDDLLKKNPIYLISTEETERMKKLAAERLPYMLKAAQNKENKILVKIGLEIDEEFKEAQNDYEHIWFELMEAGEDHVKCKLTQEPYYVKDMHTGSEGIYSFDRITDWLIFTKERRYTADDVYLLEGFSSY